MAKKEEQPRHSGRLEDRELETASTERVVSFLEKLASPVIHGPEPRQVLMANLLKDGEKRPMVEGQELVGAIETPAGWKKVRDNDWVEAMKVFLKDQLDCDYHDILEAGGVQADCSVRDNRYRQEIQFATKRTGIYLLRVEEYNPEFGAIELLGIDVFNLANQPTKEELAQQ